MTDRDAILTTSRLTVRPWTLADEDAAWAIYGDPEVMRFVSDGTPHADREQTRAWLRRREDMTAAGGPLGAWAVVERTSGSVIGTTLLMAFLETDDVEVGYQFRRSAWGHGYATEVARATVDYGFAVARLQRVVAVAYPENLASQRVLEKVGFRRQGTFPYRGLEPYYFVLDAPTPAPDRS